MVWHWSARLQQLHIEVRLSTHQGMGAHMCCTLCLPSSWHPHTYGGLYGSASMAGHDVHVVCHTLSIMVCPFTCCFTRKPGYAAARLVLDHTISAATTIKHIKAAVMLKVDFVGIIPYL